ncbi:peptidoglycan DD-metalloendopeptidase family protein [Pseudomonas matsuisoli]|uniref:peptidoglycan DD-metalloendopeptidase family protein n=1 Tax=Pseudomonas matsuisoli TaxID=1515666 RepID=UPI001669B94A|nr:peptidoglycan DD-metalloendopeptidase family protein [Pseudomonas matsuisoli]
MRFTKAVRLAGLAVSLLLCVSVAGCASSSGGVQVIDRNGPTREPVRSGQYKVQRGDTLYSIAFRFGWDWRALAAHNRIAAPYVIHPGQTIRFGSGASTVATAPRTVRPAVSNTPVVVARPTPPPITSGASSTPAPAPAPKPTVSAPASTPVQKVTVSSAGWGWPSNGQLIGRFSSNGSLNKGIDIAGQLGQPVLAAANGTVVYAGSGLRGYGELLIIKHSDTYVSAYGHNRRLLVKEGQQVKVGQTIAEMGSTGADRVKLHFEIRRQGKPVDPLQYLPNR